MTIKMDLIAARALIDTPEKWHKGGWGKDGCFCAVGAVREVTRTSAYSVWATGACIALEAAIEDGPRDVPSFNDRETTTHADIMALFDRAIEAA